MMTNKLAQKLGLSALITLSTLSVNAQEFYGSHEMGFGIGASTYFGDLNPNYGYEYIRPSASIFYRYHINPYISLRANLLGTNVGYKDAWSKNEFQQMRNLEFQSYIVEASVVGEFNFFWFETGNLDKRWTPYVLLGIGGFYYSPYVNYNGSNVNLRKIGTEGQNTAAYSDRKYSSFSICLPVGVGLKWWVKPGMNMAIDVANRFTATDYIDDVSKTYVGADKFSVNGQTNTSVQLQDRSNGQSNLGKEGQQRGDRVSFDQYFNVQVTLSLQLKTYRCPSHLKGVWSK